MKSLDELLPEAQLLHRSGRLEDAAGIYRELLRRKPNDVNLVSLLGRLRADQQRWPEALAQAEKAARLEPGNPSYHFQHALALIRLNRVANAILALERVCALDPEFPRAQSLLTQISLETFDWRAYEKHVSALFTLARSQRAAVDPHLLLQVCDDPETLYASAGNAVAEIRALYQHLTPDKPFPHNSGHRHSKIQIGYLSGDFRNHPTTYLLSELIELHDRTRFEIIGISVGPDDAGPFRERIGKAFDRFVATLGWPLNEFSQRLHRLDLDILVDLMGHTKLNQLAFLASRPAPIQVGFLGYPGTTGADFIDYVVVDPFVVPREGAQFFSEKFAYLPDTYQPNDRKRAIAGQTPTRSACGLPDDGIVFCCFNNSLKISPSIFDIWMRLLKAVPGAVLWLLRPADIAVESIRGEAEARGVDANRLVFAEHAPLPEHLARLRNADLVLDTLPYNAHTTASDALWVGVPLVTCAGRTFASRVAGSLLRAIRVPELITYSLAEYESLALALAQDRDRLRLLRARIADNRDRAPLFDTPLFARHLEQAYSVMYENWLEGRAPRSFAVE